MDDDGKAPRKLQQYVFVGCVIDRSRPSLGIQCCRAGAAVVTKQLVPTTRVRDGRAVIKEEHIIGTTSPPS